MAGKKGDPGKKLPPSGGEHSHGAEGPAGGRIPGKAYRSDRSQLCGVDRKLPGHHYRQERCRAAGRKSSRGGSGGPDRPLGFRRAFPKPQAHRPFGCDCGRMSEAEKNMDPAGAGNGCAGCQDRIFAVSDGAFQRHRRRLGQPHSRGHGHHHLHIRDHGEEQGRHADPG